MKYVILLILAATLAVLAGWLVYRDSHKKSLTAVTTAAILAFSLIMTGISVYLPDFSRGFLDGLAESSEENEGYEMGDLTLTLDQSWTVSDFDDLWILKRLYQGFSRADDEDLLGQWLIFTPDDNITAMYCYTTIPSQVQLEDLQRVMEDDDDTTVKTLKVLQVPAVEGSWVEDDMYCREVYFILNDKCYEIDVYLDSEAEADSAMQTIIDGLSLSGGEEL